MKVEVDQLDAQLLPLQAGLSQGSYVSERKFTSMILSNTETPGAIVVSVGAFYTSIIAGCNCADDPSPVDEQTEYCEMQFDINKLTSKAVITLMP